MSIISYQARENGRNGHTVTSFISNIVSPSSNKVALIAFHDDVTGDKKWTKGEILKALKDCMAQLSSDFNERNDNSQFADVSLISTQR